METVIKAILSSVTGYGASRMVAASITRFGVATFSAIVGSLVILGAVGCAMVALWIWVAPTLGNAGAFLAVSGVLLCVFLGLVVLNRYSACPHSIEAPTQSSALLVDEALHLFKSHKGSALIAALIAGIAAGQRQR